MASMKPKTLMLMVVAVGCGLVAAYLTSQLGARQAPQAETVEVLVAEKEIPQGTLLKEPEKYFKSVAWPKEREPKNHVSSLEEMRGKILNKSLAEGQFVTPKDLSKNEGLKPRPGWRAISIKAAVDTAVAGFIQPSARVDIIATGKTPSGRSESKTLLKNILVLAVNDIDVRPEERRSLVPTTVTLEVKLEQAEKLASALDQGSLRLALRAPDDKDEKVEDDKGGTDLVEVLVAVDNIAPGTKLAEQMFEKKKVIKGTEPAHAINDLDQLVGRTVTQLVAQGTFVTSLHLEKGKEPVVAVRIPRKHKMYIIGSSGTREVNFDSSNDRESRTGEQQP
jgi:pilus assembly protein CpaB